jgi:hypothetical protein
MDFSPSVTDADNMIHITQSKLEQLIRKYARRIRKPKQTMIRKDCPQPHRPRMQYRLMAQTTQTSMSVYNPNALAYDNVAEDGEEGEDGGEGCFAVDDPKGDVVDFEAVGQVAYAFAAGVSVCDDDDFVAAVDEFLAVVR